MRVAFFVSHFPLVSETFVVNMAKGLIDAGHELDIFALAGPPPAGRVLHPTVVQYGMMNRCAELRLPRKWLLRLAAVPPVLKDAIAIHGMKALRTLPPANWRQRARSLRLLFESAMLHGRAYDILHCQFATLAPLVLDHRDAGTLQGKLVVHVRGYDITQALRAAGPGLYKRVFAEADRVVANSEHFRRAAIAAGCPADRTEVILSGLDLSGFTFRHRPPEPDGPVRVAAVGRLVEKKGFADALGALAVLCGQGRDVTLDLVGDGPLREALHQRAAACGVIDRVRFHGACPSDQVARILDRCHLFVAPSVTAASGDQDAATNTVKEAMATGLPVVATRHGGLPEMIIDGVTGFLVPERDPAALAARLAQFIDNPSLWPPMIQAARHRVEALADNAVVNRQVIGLYQRLIGAATAQPR